MQPTNPAQPSSADTGENPAPADLYASDTTAETIARIADIGQPQIDFFHREGYLAIDQVFDAKQVEQAGSAIDELIDGGNPDFRGVQFEAGIGTKNAGQMGPEQRRRAVRKLMNFVDFDVRLKALAEDAGIITLLERLMGEPPLIFQEMALLKGPGGREKPWHQDCAYFDLPLGTTVVGVWIALDEATPQNGCLHVMPGTHREGPVEHFKVRDWQICDTQIQRKRDLVVPLPAGGCLLWHGMLHHCSPTNLSDSRRRALQFHYKPQGAGKTSTEERMQLFGGEVRGAQC